MKPILKSKTIWLQILTALSLLLPPMQDWLKANPEQPVAVLIALNVIVRFFTSGKVTLFANDESAGTAGPGIADKLPAWALVLATGSLAGLIGCTLPGCSGPNKLPIHATILTDYGTIGYSSKGGIDVNVNAPAIVDLRSNK